MSLPKKVMHCVIAQTKILFSFVLHPLGTINLIAIAWKQKVL